MPHHEQLSIVPSEVWQSTPEEIEIDERIEKAVNQLSTKNPEELISELKQKVERSENGIVSATLKGENEAEYSDEEALVLFNPFANAATANMLVRAEFVRQVAKNYDVRGEDGKLKPVIMLASPGIGGSDVRLDSQEREEVKSGELGPAARELLKAVTHKDVGRVALLGFSQGADMAAAGAREAYSANLDTDVLAVGDPAGVEERGKLELARDFSAAGAGELKKAVEATDLSAQQKALGLGVADFTRFGVSALKPINQTIYSGLGKDTFEARMEEVLDENRVENIVVGYGGNSEIAKPQNIEPILERIYERYGADSLVSVRVNNANHTWGDQLKLLSKLYMRALQ